MTAPPMVARFFVDEAGDGSVFDRYGRVIVGRKDCSRFFMLGALAVSDPAAMAKDMEELRARLLADPYFRNVPSMQPERRRTAVAFHAKDDPPEVRREVFNLLLRHEIRFSAVVRGKMAVLAYVRQRNSSQASYRYHPNELYDWLVRRLFKGQLHSAGRFDVCFARRGKSDRTEALAAALRVAQFRTATDRGVPSTGHICVIPCFSFQQHGLQAVDYCLWALQRLYERGEDRFLQLIWPKVRLIIDVDDRRKAAYGVYYDSRKPLTAKSLGREAPGI